MTEITLAGRGAVTAAGAGLSAAAEAVAAGKTQLRRHESAFGLPYPATLALTDDAVIEGCVADIPGSESLTRFEKLAAGAAAQAIKEAGIDPSDPDTVFILSTTKGNVSALASDPDSAEAYLWHSAKKIAAAFGNRRTPTVVSNACISGVCAQITAMRMLRSGMCRTAVVVGADELSRFIVSGFGSFKALSEEPCRPFDAKRCGLNLGEAAAAMVLTKEACDGRWHLAAGSIHNDANHISGPSRTGEGSYRVLADLLRHTAAEKLAMVNPHGTATPYNDEMESIALSRAGMESTPACGFKGYFGHTLGAAGVLETLLSLEALNEGFIPATVGYSECGTSSPVNVSDERRAATPGDFIKLLSGFGGCNAGVLWTPATAKEGGCR